MYSFQKGSKFFGNKSQNQWYVQQGQIIGDRDCQKLKFVINGLWRNFV